MAGDLKVKKETKVVLLFTPDELLKNFTALSLLHIQKSDGKLSYTTTAIHRKEVQQQFAGLPDAAKAQLLCFQPDQIANLQKEIEQRFKQQRAGVSSKGFLTQSMLRHLHQMFQELKTVFPAVKCYHKNYKTGTKIYQTLPCTFSAERPRLRFTVVKRGGLFNLNVEAGVQENFLDCSAYNRTSFFLEKNNEYFLLSFKDYRTLEWLKECLGDGLQQEVFAERILSCLESDYPVNRNNLLEEKSVKVLPSCRVLLSELNNAFLLLTPQWLYDGILVEGPWKEKQEINLNGERIVISRDNETEQHFLDLLSSLHPNFPAQRNGYYYLSFADAQKKQWFIKTYYHLLEKDVEVTGMDMLHHFRYSAHKAETTLVVKREEGSYVYFQLTLSFGRETVSLPLLQKALYAGQRAIVLKDGSLGILNDEWLSAYAALVKHGKILGGEIQVSKFFLLEEGDESGTQPVWKPAVRQGWREQWSQWQNSAEPLYPLPSTINATLRPYQQKGFEWLALLSQVGAGACLADDMGLGKTLQTICFLAWYSEQHPGARHLIVCPTSLVYNWQRELQQFAPALHVEVYHGNLRNNAEVSAQVVITSYGTLRSNSDVLLAQQFGVAVIDESHNIKNPSAQITRVTHQIEASIRIALSGTPVVNNTFDLYSQVSFAVPGLLGVREFFKREYADAIDRYGDEAKMKALQKLTAPFILRRTKEQVAKDLPPKTEAVLWCTMSAAQEELYNGIKEQVRSNLFLDIQNNGLNKAKLAVLQGLLKLRQVCNHPQLLAANEHQGRTESAKTEALMAELLQVLRRHKVLVFSQFSSMLQLLAQECDEKGISYFLLDGQTPAQKRMQMVHDFQQNTEAPSLFFISLKAGNTGLTLTAADYVFLFDPWWNMAVEQQAIDRTHRIGQTKNVFSYKLICKNSIEEKILELQERKKQLSEELITAEEDFVKSLGEEELAYLLA